LTQSLIALAQHRVRVSSAPPENGLASIVHAQTTCYRGTKQEAAILRKLQSGDDGPRFSIPSLVIDTEYGASAISTISTLRTVIRRSKLPMNRIHDLSLELMKTGIRLLSCSVPRLQGQPHLDNKRGETTRCLAAGSLRSLLHRLQSSAVVQQKMFSVPSSTL
jgi:hypothetical protein